MICIKFPLRIVSEMNARGHWRKRHRRFHEHREIVAWEILQALGDDRPTPPYTVTLTRISPRRMDSDNLESAFKGVRDQVADLFGIDDGDPRVRWVCDQRKGRPKEHSVEIRVDT